MNGSTPLLIAFCIKQYKRAIVYGAFALALPLDQHYYCRSTTKDGTDSDVFTKTALAVAGGRGMIWTRS
jgi:hypothetical protein